MKHTLLLMKVEIKIKLKNNKSIYIISNKKDRYYNEAYQEAATSNKYKISLNDNENDFIKEYDYINKRAFQRENSLSIHQFFLVKTRTYFQSKNGNKCLRVTDINDDFFIVCGEQAVLNDIVAGDTVEFDYSNKKPFANIFEVM